MAKLRTYQRLRLAALWSTGVLGLAGLATTVGLGWLLLTASGARFTLERVAAATGGTVSGVEGRLVGPLTIGEWAVGRPDLRVVIREASLDWAPSKLFTSELRIQSLAAREVVVESAPSPEPARPPERLTAPLRIVAPIRVGELRVGPLGASPTVSIRNLQAGLLANAGQWHVRDVRGETPFGIGTLSGTLGMTAPFALSAQGAWEGRREGATYKVQATGTGSLESLRLAFQGLDDGITGGGEAEILPFTKNPLRRLDANLKGVNLAGFAAAPRTKLDLEARLVTTADGTLLGPLRLVNAEPGPWNRQRLPVTSATAQLAIGADIISASGIDLALAGKGRVRGEASWAHAKLTARLDVRDMDLATLHTDLRPTALAGAVVSDLTGDAQSFTVSLADPRFSIDGAATIADGKLTVSRASVRASGAQAQLRGELSLQGAQPFSLEASLDRVNPAAFLASWPTGDVNGSLVARGRLAPVAVDEARLAITRSRLAGQPLEAEALIAFVGKELRRSDITATLGAARLVTKGAFGKPGDRLDLALQAPDIAPAARALGVDLAGSVNLTARLEGTLAEPSGRADLQARRLAGPNDIRVSALDAEVALAAGRAGDIRGQASLSGVSRGANPLVERAALTVSGSRTSHTLALDARFPANRSARLALAGGLGEARDQPEWRGTLDSLDIQVATPVALVAPAPLVIGPGLVELREAALRGEAGDAQLTLTRWREGTLEAKGQSRGVVVRTFMRLLGLEERLSSTLVLAGEWDMRLGDRVEGFASVRRESGDIRMGDPRRALGLETLSLRADADGAGVRATLDVQSRLAGSLRAEASGLVVRDGVLWAISRAAPVAARFSVDVPDLSWAAAWIGPDARLAGQLKGEGQLAGTVNDPVWSGRLDATRLALREPISGAEVADGTLAVALNNREARIERLTLATPWKLSGPAAKALGNPRRAQPGELSAEGRLDLATRKGALSLKADGFPLTRLDTRFLAISGDARAALDGQTITIAGALAADAGWFGLPASAAPSLSDDVVIDRGKGSERAASSERLRVDLRLDLGERLYFQGRGLDTRLAGNLRLTGEPGVNLRANGTMRTVGGTYEAYGRTLSLERGALNFVGPLDNPGLNILALRKGLPVEAGVEIIGTVSRPRARLASVPEVPDPDKLAWLVLGRGQGEVTAGDAAMLVGAANSLLGGDSPASTRILGGLGLDEFSIARDKSGALGTLPQSTVAGRTGTATPAEVFTVGKRLTDELSVSYQQGLAETEGSLRVAWQLTRSLQLILRAGHLPGVDAVYRLSFD